MASPYAVMNEQHLCSRLLATQHRTWLITPLQYIADEHRPVTCK